MLSFSAIYTEVMLNKYQLFRVCFHIFTCCKCEQRNHWRELKGLRVWACFFPFCSFMLILLMKIFVNCEVLMIIDRLFYKTTEGESIQYGSSIILMHFLLPC